MRRARVFFALLFLVCLVWLASRSLRAHGHDAPQAAASSAAPPGAWGAPPTARFAPPRMQKLEGWVGDAQKHGLPMAQVCAWALADDLADEERTPACVRTGEDGRYTFVALPLGRYEVTAGLRGYLPARYGEGSDRPWVELLAQGEPAPADILLTPGGASLEGTVVDPLGRPVMGAQVTASVLADNENTAADTVGLTDASGKFALWSASGPMLVAVVARDYVPTDKRVVAPSTSIQLSLEWSGTIVGNVIDAASGAPVPYALVSAHQETQIASTTRAAADGTYRIEGLPLGDYRVEANAPGRFGETMAALHLEGGDAATAPALLLHAVASVTGRVRLPSGAPCTDGQVTLRAESPPHALLTRDLGHTGEAYFAAVHLGTWELRVECEGYDASSSSSSLSVGADGVATFDLTVADGFTVSGVVVDATGKPAADASISARLASVAGDSRSIYRNAKTKSDGTFLVRGLPAGDYELEASAGKTSTSTRKVTITNANAEVRITLGKEATLAGRVVDEDGKPIADLDISVDGRAGYGHASTDRDGRFVVHGLSTGDGAVSVRRSDGGALQVVSPKPSEAAGDVFVDLVEGNETRIDLRVERASHVIRGKVVDAAGAAVMGVSVEIERNSATDPGEKEHERFYAYAAASSDKAGRFELAGLPNGPYRIRAFSSKHGFASSPSVATDVELVVTLQANADIVGTVALPGGGAPERFVVRLEPKLGIHGGRVETYFKNGGAFSFAGVAAGQYDLSATASAGSAKGEVTVTPGGRASLTLTLVTFGEIVGTIVLPDGSAATSAHVIADGPDDDAPGNGSSDAHGAFRIRMLPPGTYRVRARVDGHGDVTYATVTVEVTSGGVVTLALKGEPPKPAEPDDPAPDVADAGPALPASPPNEELDDE